MKGVQCKHLSTEELFDAIRAYYKGGPTPDKALSHKYPTKVIMRKMEALADKGILEYGVSLRTAWIVAERKPQ